MSTQNGEELDRQQIEDELNLGTRSPLAMQSSLTQAQQTNGMAWQGRERCQLQSSMKRASFECIEVVRDMSITMKSGAEEKKLLSSGSEQTSDVAKHGLLNDDGRSGRGSNMIVSMTQGADESPATAGSQTLFEPVTGFDRSGRLLFVERCDEDNEVKGKLDVVIGGSTSASHSVPICRADLCSMLERGDITQNECESILQRLGVNERLSVHHGVLVVSNEETLMKMLQAGEIANGEFDQLQPQLQTHGSVAVKVKASAGLVVSSEDILLSKLQAGEISREEFDYLKQQLKQTGVAVLTAGKGSESSTYQGALSPLEWRKRKQRASTPRENFTSPMHRIPGDTRAVTRLALPVLRTALSQTSPSVPATVSSSGTTLRPYVIPNWSACGHQRGTPQVHEAQLSHISTTQLSSPRLTPRVPRVSLQVSRRSKRQQHEQHEDSQPGSSTAAKPHSAAKHSRVAINPARIRAAETVVATPTPNSSLVTRTLMLARAQTRQVRLERMAMRKLMRGATRQRDERFKHSPAKWALSASMVGLTKPMDHKIARPSARQVES